MPDFPTSRAVPRSGPDLLAAAARRLTARDRYIARMCFDHRVLTTGQITQLAFTSPTTAKHRLTELARLRVVDRVRPFTFVGSAPWHHVLGPTGAAILAAEDGTPLTELGYRRDHAIAVLYSRDLGHLRGTNGFFCHLAAHARHHPASALITWWGEQHCRTEWGTYARPDAYATWQDAGHRLSFCFEYDTGTEPLDRVAAKLDDYTHLADALGAHLPVLFWLQGPTREAHLRARLTRHAYPAVATAHLDPAVSDLPAGQLWQPVDRRGPRLRLAELAACWPTPPDYALPDTRDRP